MIFNKNDPRRASQPILGLNYNKKTMKNFI